MTASGACSAALEGHRQVQLGARRHRRHQRDRGQRGPQHEDDQRGALRRQGGEGRRRHGEHRRGARVEQARRQVAEQGRRDQEPQLGAVAHQQPGQAGAGGRQQQEEAEQGHHLGLLPVLPAHPPQEEHGQQDYQDRHQRHRREGRAALLGDQQAEFVDRQELHRGHPLAGAHDVLPGHVGLGDVLDLGHGLLAGDLSLGVVGEEVGLQRGGHQVGDPRLGGEPLLLGQVAQQDQVGRVAHQGVAHLLELAGADPVLQRSVGQRQRFRLHQGEHFGLPRRDPVDVVVANGHHGLDGLGAQQRMVLAQLGDLHLLGRRWRQGGRGAGGGGRRLLRRGGPFGSARGLGRGRGHLGSGGLGGCGRGGGDRGHHAPVVGDLQRPGGVVDVGEEVLDAAQHRRGCRGVGGVHLLDGVPRRLARRLGGRLVDHLHVAGGDERVRGDLPLGQGDRGDVVPLPGDQDERDGDHGHRQDDRPDGPRGSHPQPHSLFASSS